MCDVGQHVESSMFYKNIVTGSDFDFDKFSYLMEDVSSWRPFISITSTEPLLYPHIRDAVALVKGMGMEMNITTNGVLLERYAEDLVKLGLDKLTISIDGPPDIHDAIRGVPGTFEKAMRGVAAIHEFKKRFGVEQPVILVNSTICDLNVDHLGGLFKSLPWDKISRVGLMPMVFLTKELADAHNRDFGRDYPATSTCLSGGVSLEKIDPVKVFETLKVLKDQYGERLHLYFRNELDYLKTYFRSPSVFLGNRNCLFPWYAAQISAQGDLLGLTRCYATTFGNVLDDGFMAAWNGPKMRKFRMDLKKLGSFPACSRCEGVLAC